MKKELMEILACPIDKTWPLNLTVFEEEKEQVKSGIIECPRCFRWYPIKDFVPELLPDARRDETAEKEFLRTWRHRLQNSILLTGIPFNIVDELQKVEIER